MKGYRIFKVHPSGAEILSLTEVEEIVLGESGRGREKVIIPLVGEGEYGRIARSDGGVVIARCQQLDDADGKAIAIINTYGGYSQYRQYDILDETGDIQIVTSGYFADGAAGRAGGGWHHLAIIGAGAEMRLRTKYDAYWHRWTGMNWVTETVPERSARLALAALERGEVQWL